MALDGKCEVCGMPYKKYRANSKYCSKMCRELAYKRKYVYQQKESFIVECQCCGEPFVTNDRKRKYCKNPACKESRIYVRKEPEKRKCEWCGESFESAHQNQKYCCHEHYVLAAEKRRLDSYEL